MKDSMVHFSADKLEGLSYPTVDLTMENVIRREDGIRFDEDHPVAVIER